MNERFVDFKICLQLLSSGGLFVGHIELPIELCHEDHRIILSWFGYIFIFELQFRDFSERLISQSMH